MADIARNINKFICEALDMLDVNMIKHDYLNEIVCCSDIDGNINPLNYKQQETVVNLKKYRGYDVWHIIEGVTHDGDNNMLNIETYLLNDSVSSILMSFINYQYFYEFPCFSYCINLPIYSERTSALITKNQQGLKRLFF